MKNFCKFMVVILTFILASIISGFVVVELWQWFIVPTFDMQPLRIVEAIGIMLLISFIRAKPDYNVNKETFFEKLIKGWAFLLFLSLSMLAFGWIVSLFM
jgi:hypothetical protein